MMNILAEKAWPIGVAAIIGDCDDCIINFPIGNLAKRITIWLSSLPEML